MHVENGGVMDEVIIVSADAHAGGPPQIYRDYIEERYKDDLEALIEENDAFVKGAISQMRYQRETLAIVENGDAISGGGEYGAWEFDRCLKELDREGVVAQVVIPGHQVSTLPFFGTINTSYPAELRAAGLRAYDRQMADAMAETDGRVLGIADPGPCLDMDATVAELQWVADHGFVGVAPPGQVADTALPPLFDMYYEPFWAACAESGMVLNAHAGWGFPQGDSGAIRNGLREMLGDLPDEELLEKMMTANMQAMVPADSPQGMALLGARRLLWQLMLGGVFDRHPELKLVLTEVRADWLPATLAHLDQYFAQADIKPVKKPSEYWASNCLIAPSSPRPYEIAARHEIGIERFMFGTDYPHPEGTWPNTADWIRATFGGVPEAETRLILGENAIECYGLDRNKLAKIAERIGPSIGDLLGKTDQVDAKIVNSFHNRSGYASPAEVVDTAALDKMLAADLTAFAGSNT
jgi:predicted TIM-barrel fold metal-dependent hydrolase